jgi:hypothetical protein
MTWELAIWKPRKLLIVVMQCLCWCQNGTKLKLAKAINIVVLIF